MWNIFELDFIVTEWSQFEEYTISRWKWNTSEILTPDFFTLDWFWVRDWLQDWTCNPNHIEIRIQSWIQARIQNQSGVKKLGQNPINQKSTEFAANIKQSSKKWKESAKWAKLSEKLWKKSLVRAEILILQPEKHGVESSDLAAPPGVSSES